MQDFSHQQYNLSNSDIWWWLYIVAITGCQYTRLYQLGDIPTWRKCWYLPESTKQYCSPLQRLTYFPLGIRLSDGSPDRYREKMCAKYRSSPFSLFDWSIFTNGIGFPPFFGCQKSHHHFLQIWPNLQAMLELATKYAAVATPPQSDHRNFPADLQVLNRLESWKIPGARRSAGDHLWTSRVSEFFPGFPFLGPT